MTKVRPSTGVKALVVREQREPFTIETVSDRNKRLFGVRVVAAIEVVDPDAYNAWIRLLEDRGFTVNAKGYAIVIHGDSIEETDYVSLLAELGSGAA